MLEATMNIFDFGVHCDSETEFELIDFQESIYWEIRKDDIARTKVASRNKMFQESLGKIVASRNEILENSLREKVESGNENAQDSLRKIMEEKNKLLMNSYFSNINTLPNYGLIFKSNGYGLVENEIQEERKKLKVQIEEAEVDADRNFGVVKTTEKEKELKRKYYNFCRKLLNDKTADNKFLYENICERYGVDKPEIKEPFLKKFYENSLLSFKLMKAVYCFNEKFNKDKKEGLFDFVEAFQVEGVKERLLNETLMEKVSREIGGEFLSFVNLYSKMFNQVLNNYDTFWNLLYTPFYDKRIDDKNVDALIRFTDLYEDYIKRVWVFICCKEDSAYKRKYRGDASAENVSNVMCDLPEKILVNNSRKISRIEETVFANMMKIDVDESWIGRYDCEENKSYNEYEKLYLSLMEDCLQIQIDDRQNAIEEVDELYREFIGEGDAYNTQIRDSYEKLINDKTKIEKFDLTYEVLSDDLYKIISEDQDYKKFIQYGIHNYRKKNLIDNWKHVLAMLRYRFGFNPQGHIEIYLRELIVTIRMVLIISKKNILDNQKASAQEGKEVVDKEVRSRFGKAFLNRIHHSQKNGNELTKKEKQAYLSIIDKEFIRILFNGMYRSSSPGTEYIELRYIANYYKLNQLMEKLLIPSKKNMYLLRFMLALDSELRNGYMNCLAEMKNN